MGAGRRDNTVVTGRMARALLLFTGFLGKKWISTGGTGEGRALQAEERPYYERGPEGRMSCPKWKGSSKFTWKDILT